MRIWPFAGSRASDNSAFDTVSTSGDGQQLLLVCHGKDHDGQLIMDNICAALDFGKVWFSVLDLNVQSTWPALDTFSSVILCTELISQLDREKARRLEAYIRVGGGVVVAYRGWNEHLSHMFGSQRDAAKPAIRMTTGLSCDREVFPDAAGLRLTDSDRLLEHSRFDIKRADLSPDCAVFMSDLTDNPILWTRDIGDGRLVYWNTGVLHSRALRGFIIQSVLDSMAVGVSAIAGFAMFHIDDFPASLSDARPQPVAREYPELDWDGFFFGPWHEDMMALRTRHDLKYTWYTVMNYHDVDTRSGADCFTPAMESGRDILQQRFGHIRSIADGDEYGFHGYNHEPMVEQSWPDPATLKTKLALARTLWADTVPAPLPTSWVPANNWYHADHARLLKQVFPEISVVCSMYSGGNPANGGYREFGPEPWEDGLLCLPRETYGYVLQPEARMMMLSQIAAMGVWTHFLHPDDIYDIPAEPGEAVFRRNPETLCWRSPRTDGKAGLVTQLEEWIGRVRATFPWLDFVTTSQAEARYRAHIDNQVDVRITAQTIEISSGSEGLFYAKTRKGIALVPGRGGEVVDRRHLDTGVLHVVRCSAGGGIFHLEAD